jgi:hypothetical protein
MRSKNGVHTLKHTCEEDINRVFHIFHFFMIMYFVLGVIPGSGIVGKTGSSKLTELWG